MKKIDDKKEEKNIKDMPFATIVINGYKEANQAHMKTNKRLTIIIMILLMFIAVETTYIILCWESMNPDTGLIRKDNSE